jgi:hypothetical protein
MCPVKYNSYADPTTQRCVSATKKCPTSYFTDNRERKCLQNCSIFYADGFVGTPTCSATCSKGFADPLLFTCATKCSPSFYGLTTNKTCVQSCPYGYFADSSSGLCVTKCLNSTCYYADNYTGLCSPSCSNNQFAHKPSTTYGVCLFICPATFFSDPTTMQCVKKCPQGYYGNVNNNTCNANCE